jgi:hypothetical protein
MLPVGLLSFVMIMEASSELPHHESSAKALHDLFVRSLTLQSVNAKEYIITYFSAP